MGFKITFQVGGRGPKFQNYCRYVTFQIFGLKIRFLNARKWTNFENHSRTHQLDIKSLQCPFGVQGRSTQRGPKGRVWWGWTGGTGGRSRKVSSKFLHNLWVYRYKYFYLYTKLKLSPTFLWVSKFHVKLGVVVKNLKITAGRWFFFFWV